MPLNAVGAALSAIVFVIATMTKFSDGGMDRARVAALLVLVTRHIRRHYDRVHRTLALHPLDLAAPSRPIVPARVHGGDTPRGIHGAEDDESPDQLQHRAVVPIARLDLSSLRALAYAASLGSPLLALT